MMFLDLSLIQECIWPMELSDSLILGEFVSCNKRVRHGLAVCSFIWLLCQRPVFLGGGEKNKGYTYFHHHSNQKKKSTFSILIPPGTVCGWRWGRYRKSSTYCIESSSRISCTCQQLACQCNTGRHHREYCFFNVTLIIYFILYEVFIMIPHCSMRR